MGHIEVITHLLTIDPNFQRDIQVRGVVAVAQETIPLMVSDASLQAHLATQKHRRLKSWNPLDYLSNETRAPGWLGYIWGWNPTQLYRDYNKPL